MKVCAGCRWHHRSIWNAALCVSPYGEGITNCISGRLEQVPCAVRRAPGSDCGPTGMLWVPKALPLPWLRRVGVWMGVTT